MPDILIRDLDKKTLKELKERAAANRRSVQAEVKEIIERVAREKTFEQLQQQLENFSKRFRGRKMTDTVKLVREDRGR
jgi:plasmid stability protein